MSFDTIDIIPVEYQDLFTIISPVEKSGILKFIKKTSDKTSPYARMYNGLLDYITTYKDEDISPLAFIMFAQIAQDLEKKEKILELLELFPKSPELLFYKIEFETDKGQFEDIDSVLSVARLSDEERKKIFTRLVSAEKLARIILDLQSFGSELRYYVQKQEFDKVRAIYETAEKIWKEALDWTKNKEITFLTEQIIHLVLTFANILISMENVNAAVDFYEQKDVQEILEQAESTFAKCSVLYVSANIYYTASQPQKAIKQMEKAIELLPNVFGRKQWKSNFYHNYGVMLTIIDLNRSIDAFEKSLELLNETEDYQSVVHTLSNLISLKMEINAVDEAREMLKQIVELIDKNKELATPFRVYSVAVNAISLEDPILARKYLDLLEQRVKKNPTPKNMGHLCGANLYYYMDLEISYSDVAKWGSDYLYYVTKENNYLNIVTALFNLAVAEFQFYRMAGRNRYLNASKKRLLELLSFIGKLEQKDYLAMKHTLLAGYEILLDNYQQATELIAEIPEATNPEVKQQVETLKELFKHLQIINSKEKETQQAEEPEKVPVTVVQPLIDEIINGKEYLLALVMHVVEQGLNTLIALPSDFKPSKADIKLILLINNAGIAIYTKLFDERLKDKQLISNFITAINSFGNEVFGSYEPYFSIKRGENIVLFQNINEELNLAMIATQENFDSISKLNSFAKEIRDYLLENKKIDIQNILGSNNSFYKWLDSVIEGLVS